MARDPQIDDYIDQAAPFAMPILQHLRELIHATVPDVAEARKWGMPHFVYKGKNLAGMGAFKGHIALLIHDDGASAAGRAGDSQPAESRAGEGMGQFGKIAALSDLPSDDELKRRLLAVRDRIDSGKKPVPKPKAAEIPMPDDFAAALSPAARTFLDGLSPYYRKEYLEWITSAKRAETRASRIAQAAEWLAEQKKRNWQQMARQKQAIG